MRWTDKVIAVALFVLGVLWILWGLSGAFAADFNKKCEAQVIADFKPFLSKEQWLEVIEAGLAEGAVDEAHAKELRNHVEGVYKSPEYAGRVCKRQEV